MAEETKKDLVNPINDVVSVNNDVVLDTEGIEKDEYVKHSDEEIDEAYTINILSYDNPLAYIDFYHIPPLIFEE